jgi:hypothetical protein
MQVILATIAAPRHASSIVIFLDNFEDAARIANLKSMSNRIDRQGDIMTYISFVDFPSGGFEWIQGDDNSRVLQVKKFQT